MGVRASMSVVSGWYLLLVAQFNILQSIMAFGGLWGLIACHSYGTHRMRVSFPVRQMLRLLSQSISRNIERLIYAQRLHTRITVCYCRHISPVLRFYYCYRSMAWDLGIRPRVILFPILMIFLAYLTPTTVSPTLSCL
jgi:hypothetical protein